MESITIFLRDFGYFNLGCLVGGIITFTLAVLAFAGPLYDQAKDIERLKEKNDKLTSRNSNIEAVNRVCQEYKNKYQNEYMAELNRADMLEQCNGLLQTKVIDLEEENKKIYVELDALKARSFQNDKAKSA